MNAGAEGVLRRRRPLDGLWLATPVTAAFFEELERRLPEAGEPRELEVPFLEIHPEHNAYRLEKRFLWSGTGAGADEEPAWCAVRIGAAMLAVRVSLNGALLGSHSGGYTPCEFPLPFLKRGENRITIDLLGEQAAFLAPGAIRNPVSVSIATLSGDFLEKWKAATGWAAPGYRVGLWQTVELVERPAAHVAHLKITPWPVENALELRWRLNATSEAAAGDRWEWSISRPARPGEVGAAAVREGELSAATVRREGDDFVARIAGEGLEPWHPDTPMLYHLTLGWRRDGRLLDRCRERFGYRQFGIRGGQFLLNGMPLVLRGESSLLQNQGLQFLNPFALDTPFFWCRSRCVAYLRHLKETLDLNALRIHASVAHPAIYEAADEVGVLLEAQSSVWSRGFRYYLAAGPEFLEACEREFREWITRDWNHPSIVIWGVDNEMHRIAHQPQQAAFFGRLREFILRWDESRPICADGGGALPPGTDFYHVHHEEDYTALLAGWKREKPLVFGEFWIGGRGAEQRLTNGDEFFSPDDYRQKQMRLWRQKIEPMRLRGASGVLPYNFSAHRLTGWSSLENGYRPEAIRAARNGLLIHALPPPREGDAASPASAIAPAPTDDPWQSARWRHLLGRFMVAFDSPRRIWNREAAFKAWVRNDSGAAVQGGVELREGESGALLGRMPVEVAAGESRLIAFASSCLEPPAKATGRRRFVLSWKDKEERLLDEVGDEFFFPEPLRADSLEGIGIHLVDGSGLSPWEAPLRQHGARLFRHRAEAIPWATLRGEILFVDGATLARVPGWERCLAESGAALFLAEAASLPGLLFGRVRTLDFSEPLPYSRQFEPIAGRSLRVGDLYQPVEAVWETDTHPVRRGFPDRHWRPRHAGEAIAAGVLLHPGVAVQKLFRQINQIGAGMDAADGGGVEAGVGREGEAVAVGFTFRSLLTGPRREYSILAEIRLGAACHLVSCLRGMSGIGGMGGMGGMDADPQVMRLVLDAIRYLSRAGAGARVGAVKGKKEPPVLPFPSFPSSSPLPALPAEIIHNIAALSEEEWPSVLGPGLELARLARPVDAPTHLALDQRGLFSSTKCGALLSSLPADERLLVPRPGMEIVGGWLALESNESYEVSGPFFPWEFQSEHPRVLGYRAVGIREEGRLRLFLLDPWPAASGESRDEALRLLEWQIDDHRRQGGAVTILDAAKFSHRQKPERHCHGAPLMDIRS